MAIAFDAGTYAQYTNGTSLTFSHTCTGSDRILFVMGHDKQDPTSIITGVTYDGIAMTQVNTLGGGSGTDRAITLWYLIAPATGSNDVVVSASESDNLRFSAVSYTGASQAGQPEGTDTSFGSSVITISTDITTTVNNCWMLMFSKDDAGSITYTNTTGDTIRLNTDAGGHCIVDTNEAIADVGTNTITNTMTSTSLGALAVTFQPALTKEEIEHCVDDDTVALWHCNGAVGDKSIDLERGGPDYAYHADAAVYDITGDWSVEAWVNFETAGATECPIFAKWRPGDDNRSYKVDFYNNTLRVLTSTDGTIGNVVTQTVAWTPTTGQWYHLAYTYDQSAGEAKFYVNGVQQGATQTSGNTTINSGTSKILIGRASETSGAYWDGKLQDVRLWDDKRTDSEIKDNYQSELTGSEDNLVGYWKFAGDLTDDSTNSNTLTGSGSPTYSTEGGIGKSSEPANGLALTEVNTPTAATGFDGEANGAYDLNGSTQYLSVADNAALDITGDMTIECWVNHNSTPSSDVYQMYVGKGDQSNDKQSYYFALRNDGGTLKLFFRKTSSGANATSGGIDYNWTPSTGTWYYVAIVYDESANFGALYINGVQVTSATDLDDLGSGIYSSDIDLRIGACVDLGSGSQYMDGEIDEVKISTRTKSAEEIAKYYSGTVSALFRPAAGQVSPVDGDIYYSGTNVSWDTIQGAATGSGVSDTGTLRPAVRIESNSTGYDSLERSIICVDPSGLPDSGITIDYAKISLYESSSSNTWDATNTWTFNVYSAAPASTSSLAVGDYDSLGTTEYATGIAYTALSSGAYNDFVFNATGITAIDTTGVNKFGIRESIYDAPDTAPTHAASKDMQFKFYFADETGTTKDPYLWVEYTAEGETTVSPDAVVATASIPDPTIAYGYVITPDVTTVTLTIPEPTLVLPITVSPDELIINLTIPNPMHIAWANRTKPNTSWTDRTEPSTSWTKE
tara:strand:- start:306 stop:3200 length:2895 start_codon:yes stop_codon:yes gene_type:complete